MKTSETAGIILAAGASERFGSPKQLAQFRGKPLLEWVIDAADRSDLDRIILVLGHAHDQILTALDSYFQDSGICAMINHDYRSGQSSSLRLGLAEVSSDCQAAMFLLCDQPLIDTQLINHLITAFRKSAKTICVPVCDGIRGNPTIFGCEQFEALMQIKGDRGGRNLLESNAGDVLEVETNSRHILDDIDTPEDLAKLNLLES